MAEDINSSASFGQSNGDEEELPIIVAQRFLNIFRQLHIFSEEKRKVFDQMLLELSPDIQSMIQSLPGGTPLHEYIEDLEQTSKGLEPLTHHKVAKKENILTDALKESNSGGNNAQPVSGGIVNGDSFARILASSLAQSNAEIIKELQNAAPNSGVSLAKDVKGGGQMKLVADESFTKIISQALSKAIETSEKKRLEDSQMISQSFTDLKENLSKIIEQNTQVRYVEKGKEGESVVAPFQIRSLVDDLVKAQANFFQETSNNQKEQLSSLISTAIKESQKVSTQALIDSFKKINEENTPMPITYTANSPKGAASLESVEQALKVQGKEFSSIISTALKESQKNSTQAIIETLETIKKNTDNNQETQNTLKVEDIMRMQANLFRDIARAQNQEFSALISAALKESQHQSTQAIIAALGQLQNSGMPINPMQIATQGKNYSSAQKDLKSQTKDGVQTQFPLMTDLLSQPQENEIKTPFIDKYIKGEKSTAEAEDLSQEQITEENPKKKKKKKKKKNKNTIEEAQEDENIEEQKNVEKNKKVSPKENKDTIKTTEKSVAEKDEKQVQKEEKSNRISESLLRLMSASSFGKNQTIQDTDDAEGWGWGFEEDDKKNTTASDNDFQNDEYFENSEGEEGQDWEWEYEEVPADAVIDGEEGQDWEWEYEEVPEDVQEKITDEQKWDWEHQNEVQTQTETPVVSQQDELSTQSLIQNSQIILDKMPKFVLIGLEDENFKDPYIENNDNIG